MGPWYGWDVVRRWWRARGAAPRRNHRPVDPSPVTTARNAPCGRTAIVQPPCPPHRRGKNRVPTGCSFRNTDHECGAVPMRHGPSERPCGHRAPHGHRTAEGWPRPMQHVHGATRPLSTAHRFAIAHKRPRRYRQVDGTPFAQRWWDGLCVSHGITGKSNHPTVPRRQPACVRVESAPRIAM